MAGVLQHLRSSTLDKRPNPASMVDGQVAINYASGAPGMFFKDSNGSLVKVGPVHVGSGAPNASPASGGTAGNSLGEQWLDTSGGTYVFKVWDGSAWRSEAGEFVNVTGDTMTGALGIIAGSASTPGLFFSGDANSGLYSPGADQVAISTNGTGRLFVDASGNVGLATSSPISVGVTGMPAVTLASATSGRSGALYWSDTGLTNKASSYWFGSVFNFGTETNHPVVFTQNASEKMRLTATGLGLGSSNPLATNHIRGSGTSGQVTASWLLENASSGTVGMDVTGAPGSSIWRFLYGGGPSTGTNALTPAITIGVEGSAAGRVGIGDNAPSHKLVVRQNNSGGVAAIHLPEDESTILGSTANTNIKMGGNMTVSAGGVLGFNTNGSERARIDSSGRLLVGTSTSVNNALEAGLQVVGTGADAYFSITRYNSTASAPAGIILGRSKSGTKGTNTAVADGDFLGIVEFTGADGGSSFRSAASVAAYVDGAVTGGGAADMPGRLVFSTTADGASSPTERMRIGQNGYLKASNTGSYISTTDNWHEIIGSNAGSTLNVRNTASSATRVLFVRTPNATESGTDEYLLVGGTVTDHIYIFNNGNIKNTNNSYGAISDIKLKENIVDATSQWSDLKALQVRKYNFKEGQTHTQIGLVAQEVELVSPGLVSESPDRDDEGNDLGTVTKSVNYSVLYMKAVKALQEAMERIETLEAENAHQKASLTDILSRISALEGA